MEEDIKVEAGEEVPMDRVPERHRPAVNGIVDALGDEDTAFIKQHSRGGGASTDAELELHFHIGDDITINVGEDAQSEGLLEKLLGGGE